MEEKKGNQGLLRRFGEAVVYPGILCFGRKRLSARKARLIVVTVILATSSRIQAGQEIQVAPSREDSSLSPALEMMEKIVEADEKFAIRAEEVFCAEVRARKDQDFDRFVQKIIDDNITIAGSLWVPTVKRQAFRFFMLRNQSAPIRCLTDNAGQPSGKTAFNFYLILKSTNGGSISRMYEWLVYAAKAGHPLAQYWLSERIYFNIYEPQTQVVPILKNEISFPSYYRWLRMAAEQGVPIAQYRLGEIFVSRATENLRKQLSASIPSDPLEGIRWLELAAQSSASMEYPPSLVDGLRNRAAELLGEAYFYGDPPLLDYGKALQWLHRVPDGLLSKGACTTLWRIYDKGLGTPVDPEKAQYYLRLAAPES